MHFETLDVPNPANLDLRVNPILAHCQIHSIPFVLYKGDSLYWFIRSRPVHLHQL